MNQNNLLLIDLFFIGFWVSVLSLHWSPDTVLIVSQKSLSADCNLRPSIVINQSSPGPELRFNENQRLWIRVINQLDNQPLTIHFHGLAQFGSPFADGTQKISQNPIPPNGGYFDYEFKLEGRSAGTYIYHAHYGFQHLTAYGSFIIQEHKHKIPYHYDDEFTLIFADYYHATDDQIISGLKAKPIKFLGEPQSLLVNGRALGTCNSSNPHGCSNSCHHHLVKVKPDTTYRVRVIGITALTYLYFAIESHPDLFLIEVDGGYVKKEKTSYIQLGSGQRYSFLLKTKTLSELKQLSGQNEFFGRVESRWRAKKDLGAFLLQYDTSSLNSTSNLNNSLNNSCNQSSHISNHSSITLNHPQILSKNSSIPLDQNYAQKAIPLPDEGHPWLINSFRPLISTDEPPTSDQVSRRIIISSQQRKADDGSVNWFVNNNIYVEDKPHIPFLVRAYTTGLKPNYTDAFQNNGFDSSLKAYPIKLGEVIEFVIINLSSTVNVSEAHPWHFHGQKFSVIAQGFGEFNEASLRKAESRHRGRSIKRDTHIVLAGKNGRYFDGPLQSGTQAGWTVVRLKAQTPGAFLVHCHLQVHAIMGMGLVLLIGIEHLPPLPSYFLKAYTSPSGVRLKEPISYFDSIENQTSVSS
ncbi:hypothetical protein O181_058858 [Austropuccinia psidii MF-1]|uniref:laccase n=1 Tax=Austropuccinia psidii MF-1 TaxID=1389203 RepID=A0A9Q3HVZ8_9BASI|nr:hypothetical protein [Austropuccinia psidii MF-1]